MLPAGNLEQRKNMKKGTKYKGQFIAKTDIGCVREKNEDQAAAIINASGNVLLCVCDGMGGHNKGDYASKLAIDTITEDFKNKNGFISNFSLRQWIARTMRKVNKIIFDEAQTNPNYKDMGTTVNMVIIYNDSIFVINAGDSRAYFVRKKALEQLSEDQTYVEYLYHTGKMSKEEMETSPQRHILMNAVGTFPSVSYDLKYYPNNGLPILVCTDGLYNNATEAEVRSALLTDERVDQKVETLIGIAKSNGGSDNIGIAYWEAYQK